MAELGVLTNAYLSLGGTDLSAYLRSLNAPEEVENKDDTAMGDTARSMAPGLLHFSLTAEFNQDYAAGGPDATINALLGTTFAVEWHPAGASVSTSNPKRTGTGTITSYTAVTGAVGDQATCSVSIEGVGTWTRATS